MLTVSPNQMATLKLLPAVLLAQPSLTSTLPQFPPFQILFFMRFVENNTEGLPSREPRPLVHLPAIRDHKSPREWNRCCRCCGVLVVLRWEVLTSGQAWSRRTGWIGERQPWMTASTNVLPTSCSTSCFVKSCRMNEDTFDRRVCPGGHEGLSDLCKWEFKGKRSWCAPLALLGSNRLHNLAWTCM